MLCSYSSTVMALCDVYFYNAVNMATRPWSHKMHWEINQNQSNAIWIHVKTLPWYTIIITCNCHAIKLTLLLHVITVCHNVTDYLTISLHDIITCNIAIVKTLLLHITVKPYTYNQIGNSSHCHAIIVLLHNIVTSWHDMTWHNTTWHDMAE